MYGTLKLTETSPVQTFTEVLTLAQIKVYLGLPSDSDPADADIDSMIPAAREVAEIKQNRDLVRKQWDLWLDCFPACGIELRAPLVSVDLVKYRDSDGNYTTLAEGTDYIVDTAKEPGIVMPPYGESWPSFTPWPSSAVLVRFTSGYASTDAWWAGAGDRVRNGMKLLISAWHQNRLPFEIGANAVQEYPFAVTACLSHGALTRVR